MSKDREATIVIGIATRLLRMEYPDINSLSKLLNNFNYTINKLPTMTKKEAINQMQKGIKMTHKQFMPKQWVIIKNDKYVMEDGIEQTEKSFWRDRAFAAWDNDWFEHPSN
jgi:hypothetical protein